MVELVVEGLRGVTELGRGVRKLRKEAVKAAIGREREVRGEKERGARRER